MSRDDDPQPRQVMQRHFAATHQAISLSRTSILWDLTPATNFGRPAAIWVVAERPVGVSGRSSFSAAKTEFYNWKNMKFLFY